nr:minor capsid protein [uncultured Caproiciproducens sp.]
MPSYWETRAIDSIGRMESAVDGALPELVKSFEQAKRDLNDTVFKFYARYAKNNKISLDEAQKVLSLSELQDFRGDLNEFERLAKDSIGTFDLQVDNLSVKARITRYEALLTQCDGMLQKLYQEQKKQIEGTATQVYTEEYYRRQFDIEKYTGFQFNFSQPSTSAIRKVLEQPVQGMDISTRLWRQDIDTGFRIRSTLNNMFMTGRPPQDFSTELQKAIGAVRTNPDGTPGGVGKKYEAYRLLYNESSHAVNQAHLQAYRDDGLDEYEVVATLDKATCDICSPQDGKHYPVDKAVEGVNHPSFHVNCRCTTAPYIGDLDSFSGERMARDPVTGKSIPTTAQTYGEWKAQQDEKYGVGTVDTERKKAQNEVPDFQQYQKVRSTLGENAPFPFANYQDQKYNNPEEFAKTQRQLKTFEKIYSKDVYTVEYKQKLKDTYQFFRKNGFEFTEHALNRTVGQKHAKDKVNFTQEQLLGILQKVPNYTQPNGHQVRFYDDLAVIQATDTSEIVSIVTRKTPKADWSENK